MADDIDRPVDVLRAVWAADESSSALDEICTPQKSCRNMRDVSFAGFGDSETGSDTDLATAWHDRLAREGKLGATGASIRDLVLGSTEH